MPKTKIVLVPTDEELEAIPIKSVRSLAKAIADIGGVWWCRAVLMVYLENRIADLNSTSEFSARSDTWTLCETVKSEGLNRAEVHWCKITKRARNWFPFSVNGFTYMYQKFRKRNGKQILAYCEEFQLTIKNKKLLTALEAEKAEVIKEERLKAWKAMHS